MSTASGGRPLKYADASARLDGFRRQIALIRREMRDTQARAEPQEVSDYVFANDAGPVTLSQLFGDRQDLILIHNMGTSCPNCTLWADGYNGVHRHVVTRAAFAMTSPDEPAVQRRFAESRGWTFPMVSHRGTSFAADMGFVSRSGQMMPGVSVFQRRGARIVRVSDTVFQPGDDYCVLWHFFDLLPGGAGDWQAETATPAAAQGCCSR